MIDRFVTSDARLLEQAFKALVSGGPFEATVQRPECAPDRQVQNWRGYVTTKLQALGAGIQIEVNRFDV